jgi:hypothetical protein
MLTALILICSLAATPDLRGCNRDNAVDSIRVPETFGNPAMCLMHSQAYLAETSLGREMNGEERLKVVCVRSAPLPAVASPAPPEAAKPQ